MAPVMVSCDIYPPSLAWPYERYLVWRLADVPDTGGD